MKNSRKLGLVLGPLAFIYFNYIVKLDGLSAEGHATLAGTSWIAIWWISEAIPIAATSLLPIVLFPLTGAIKLSEVTASYGHKYIFLYMGGFILAIAIETWGLHKRIALTIINLIGTNMKQIVLGFMVATAFLSMWISNTATSVMLVPIGMAMVSQLDNNPLANKNDNIIFGKMLMLAIAYSASIGGFATIIGTPPNLVLVGVIQEQYGIEITFSTWIVFGLPVSITLLLICWKYLTAYAFKLSKNAFPGGKEEIKRQLSALGKITYEEQLVLLVFGLTGLAWISRSYVLQKFIPHIDDTIIAVTSGLILFVLPASKEKNRQLINWEEAVKLPWGVLFLFGGGLAIAKGFNETGLAVWIGSQVSLLEGGAILLILLIIVTAVNFLTEITSNLATVAMLLPILVPISASLNIHPYILMIGATIAASCAFMLPVATPPNAVVFGSGYLKMQDMVKTGIWLNIISIILITLLVYFILPVLWGFDLVGKL